jgi:hypothetical protein
LSIEHILQKEIEDSRRWLEIEKDDSTYKRDLQKRIELINWVLEKMNNPDIFICQTIESKMNEIINKINETNSIIEADPLHSELRILDWTLYQVCSNEIKKFERNIILNKIQKIQNSSIKILGQTSAWSHLVHVINNILSIIYYHGTDKYDYSNWIKSVINAY